VITHIDLTLPVELILFAIFFALLNVLFYRPASAVFRQRNQQIEAGQRAAEEAQRRAEETAREVQRQLDAARVEAQGLIAAANKDAGAQRQRLMDEARQQADALAQQAREGIQEERRAAVELVRREAAPLAILVASKVTEQPLDTQANRELADRAVAEAGGG